MPLLTAESLNDFFLPSQDCIKPVEIIKTNADSEIRIDNGVHWEVTKDGLETQLEAASISLNDCLACSGCVTTAESVLVGLQSWGEVSEKLKDPQKKQFVASICPQSVASIAACYNVSRQSAYRKLRTLLKNIGFSQIYSTNLGRAVSLHESSREFIQYYKGKPTQPLLASACPGWICYAEKQKSSLIPIISKVRSPQQMTGVILKDVITRCSNLPRDSVYHVAIMPCFDKKLEASRKEFEVDTVRDVDTVVTSAEVVNMMREAEIDFEALEESTEDDSPSPGRQPGSSSGGYLAHVLVTAAKELFDMTIPASLDDDRIRITDQRSPKLKEYELLDDQGQTLLRFADAYGFRQITSLTQKLAPKVQRRTTKKVDYDYVEVMACESGCINGGGQVRPPPEVSNRDWVSKAEVLYVSEDATPASATQYQEIIQWWKAPHVEVEEKTRTTYNEIPPMANPLASKW